MSVEYLGSDGHQATARVLIGKHVSLCPAGLSLCPSQGPKCVVLRDQRPLCGSLTHCKEEARIPMLSGVWHLSQGGLLPWGLCRSPHVPPYRPEDCVIINMPALSGPQKLFWENTQFSWYNN